MQTDPIADFLTAIRNANSARHTEVTIRASNLKLEIARILKEEGYIDGYEALPDSKQGQIKVTLRYIENRERVFKVLERVSKPGRRVYVGKGEIDRVQGGLGVAILSTPRGVLTDRAARRAGVGGEVLARVY
jgi:small subunit ribosomal protein S8